jgi:hypothetical protein
MTKYYAVGTVLICLILLAGCPKVVKDRTAEQSDIFEIVLRHQIAANDSAKQNNARAYCLTILFQDPSDEFMARFKDNQPPVKKGSEFEEGKDLQFSVSYFKWIEDKTIEVKGSYYEGNLSAGGCKYHIILENGKWIIKSTSEHWIS